MIYQSKQSSNQLWANVDRHDVKYPHAWGHVHTNFPLLYDLQKVRLGKVAGGLSSVLNSTDSDRTWMKVLVWRSPKSKSKTLTLHKGWHPVPRRHRQLRI